MKADAAQEGGAWGWGSSAPGRATHAHLQEAPLRVPAWPAPACTLPPAPVLGEGHILISPVIVPVAERSHRNGEGLPHWV